MPDTHAADLQRRLATAGEFAVGALEANRAGRLTPDQIMLLEKDEQSTRRIVTGVAVVVVVASAGVMIVHSALSGPLAWAQDGLPLLLILLGLVVIRLARRWHPYQHDIATGLVAQLTGKGTRVRAYTEGESTWYCDIGSKRFEVAESAFRIWEDGLVYRAYYLPESEKLVNLEVVGAAPADTSPRGI